MSWTKEQLDAIWQKARKADGYDEDHKLDPAGAMMYRYSRQDTDMAWEVDHIFPKEILEFFHIPEDKINLSVNLRAMHHSNNESKGISFPRHSYVKVWDEDRQRNIDKYGMINVPFITIMRLKNLYEPLLGMTLEKAIEVYHMHN